MVEAVSGGRVEILRYDADTPPDAGVRVASIDDRLCRFLTAGDVDGDGVKEMVAAANKSGIWLLRPRAVGSEVIKSVSPGQMVVKIVHDTLVETLGSDSQKVSVASGPMTTGLTTMPDSNFLT